MNVVEPKWQNGLSSNSDAVVELLDRVLNRGVVLYADIVITLAGVPLVGLNLRAALGSIEAMARAVSSVAPTDPAALTESAKWRTGDTLSQGGTDRKRDQRELDAEHLGPTGAWTAERVEPWAR